MKLFVTGLSGLAIAAIVFGAVSTSINPGPWSVALRSPSTNDAYVNGDVTPISPKISGYVAEVAVRDNQSVKAGDILFRIDDRDYRARVDQANAALDGKRAMLADLNSRLALQEAIVDQAASALQAAEADAAQIGPDGNPRTTMVTWIAPPHFFRADRLIVLYIGDDPTVVDLLTALLGPPFAGG